MKIKSIVIIIIVNFLFGIVISCNQNSTENEKEKTPQELINDGWAAFESAEYSQAIEYFNAALEQDSTLWDVLQGLGWASARLGNSSYAVNAFLQTITLNSGVLSAKAGLAFIYNAQEQYEYSNQRAIEVLQLNSQWSFDHDSRVDWKDLILLKAENYFALGAFSQSLEEVQKLNSQFSADVNTIEGQGALAEEIERLYNLYN